jgi:hypothetical protein
MNLPGAGCRLGIQHHELWLIELARHPLAIDQRRHKAIAATAANAPSMLQE